MKIVAYTENGGVQCNYCTEEGDPIFITDDLEGLYGATCDKCRNYYTPWGWEDDPDYARWSCCPSCNAQRPWGRYEANIRLMARQGKLECYSCGEKGVHF